MSTFHIILTFIFIVMLCIGAYMMAYFICMSICDVFKKLCGGDVDDGDRNDTDK